MNIIEYLNEEKSPGTLYHYTNEFNIIDILKSGILKTKSYLGDKDNQRTLATVRPSMSYKAKSLSDEVGNIRFVFDIPEVTSGKLRNIKINKVAEFPISSIEDLDSYFTEKEFHSNWKIFKKLGEKGFKDYLDYKYKDELNKKDIFYIVNKFKDYEIDIKNREGEERLSLNPKTSAMRYYISQRKKGLSKKESFEKLLNRKNIPLDPSYIKIEILPGFIDDVKKMDGHYKDYNKQTLKDLIRKNRKLFIINKEYRKLMS